jgi:hypothetical protein
MSLKFLVCRRMKVPERSQTVRNEPTNSVFPSILILAKRQARLGARSPRGL